MGALKSVRPFFELAGKDSAFPCLPIKKVHWSAEHSKPEKKSSRDFPKNEEVEKKNERSFFFSSSFFFLLQRPLLLFPT